MERASLRPVPARPPGTVDPGEALGYVAERLPELDRPARGTLALVELVGRPRAEAAAELDLGPEAAAAALAVGRKALRRSLFPLPASGWCERAERLISDRLDGDLVPPGPARLDVHLRNCERCAEHERRLAQARDALVRDFVEAHPAVESAAGAETAPPAAPAAAPDLRVVEEPPPAELPEPGTAAGALAAQAAPGELPRGGTGLLWNALIGLSALLAGASLAIAVLGATGAVERIF